MSTEAQASGSGGAGSPLGAKSYSYNAFGRKAGMINTPAGGSGETYGYADDMQGSVTQLVNEAGGAQATYGYQPYGAQNEQLTQGDTDQTNPLNPYRYTGKRFDSGSGTLAMGARRFGPDTGRFLQPDRYRGAFKDLGLSVDPLTQNRMALAGANPINFVEVDGHFSWRDLGSRVKDFVTDDRVQTALDACGFAPGVGAICDVAGAVSYAAEGDWGNAALSAVGAVPGAGDALKAVDTVGAVGMAAYKASDEFAAGAAGFAKHADEGVAAGKQPLVVGEAGRFGDLRARSQPGDDLTPHHMP